MNRDEKAAVIDRIAGKIEESDAVFAVDYRGISVPQVADLRTKLRDADASFQIVKNSLTERAADKAGAEGLKALLEGPTALTFVRGDAAAAAKALNDAARATQVLDFKGGVMGGNVLTAEDIRSIARLPSREVLYGQLVGTIASPLSGLVGALSALVGGLARQLGQIAEQGLVGGNEPAAAPESEAPSDVQEAAEQPNEDPDAEPHQAPEPEASQAEGEDTSSETPKED
jgi:large subunit ribosomal protein L10